MLLQKFNKKVSIYLSNFTGETILWRYIFKKEWEIILQKLRISKLWYFVEDRRSHILTLSVIHAVLMNCKVESSLGDHQSETQMRTLPWNLPARTNGSVTEETLWTGNREFTVYFIVLIRIHVTKWSATKALFESNFLGSHFIQLNKDYQIQVDG